MGRPQWREGRHTRPGMERTGRGSSQLGPVFDRIPNFVGADVAAKRLSELDEWRRARVVKCNPDPPQIPVRLRALYDGKLLFSPVPYLTKGFPYLRIDPDKLAAKGVDFETAATAQGFMEHGEPIGFEDMPKLDFCVVGCVAVTRSGGRTGKGAGFADLEQGLFRELGLVGPSTPIATTVHSSQVVADSAVVMESHNSALHFVATELELIATRTEHPQPKGVDWDRVRPDQFADIPFLSALRDTIERRKRTHDTAHRRSRIIGRKRWRSLTRIAAEVGAACRDVGFFYVVNHGSGEAHRRSVHAVPRFFALPLADKRKLAIETIGGNRGYSGLLHEALDPARGPDMKEAFNIGLDLAPDDPELVAGKPFRSLNAWPGPAGVSRDAAGLLRRLRGARRANASRVRRDLGLSPDFFDDKFDRSMATLRLLHYPAPPAGADAQTGAGEHTDYGNLTLLATDDVGGLEVRTRAGQWIDAPVLRGAFIVNIGDCLMRWTNDVYVSTPHRVVNRSAKERYSIAFFYDPNPDAMVETIPSCVGQGEITRYPPILAADYLKMRLDASKPEEADRVGV